MWPIVKRLQEWAGAKAFAYHQAHNSYKDLPRYLEVVVSFCFGYGTTSRHKIWRGLKSAVSRKWVIR